MSAELYGSVGGASRKVKKLYANVNGVTREVKSLWANVGGVTRKVYSSAIEASFYDFTSYSVAGIAADRIKDGTTVSNIGADFSDVYLSCDTSNTAKVTYQFEAPAAVPEGSTLATFNGQLHVYLSNPDVSDVTTNFVISDNPEHDGRISFSGPYKNEEEYLRINYTFIAKCDISKGQRIYIRLFCSFRSTTNIGGCTTFRVAFPWSGITFGPDNEKIVLKTT